MGEAPQGPLGPLLLEDFLSKKENKISFLPKIKELISFNFSIFISMLLSILLPYLFFFYLFFF